MFDPNVMTECVGPYILGLDVLDSDVFSLNVLTPNGLVSKCVGTLNVLGQNVLVLTVYTLYFKSIGTKSVCLVCAGPKCISS